MDITQEGVILLMKSAITGEGLSLPQGFRLEEAVPILKRHMVLPLGYLGAAQCGISRTDPLMQKLFLDYRQSAIHSRRQMEQVTRICAAFEENGIDYMPVKGCNMKPRYPSPELRYMGDADILIRLEQYPAIRTIMTGLGFEEGYESDHELVWDIKDLHVELHKRLIPSYNKDYFAYYGNGWKLAKFSDGHRFRMSPEDEFVYVFTHFAKHYRDGGIGLRQLMDLWILRRNSPQMDEGYVEKTLKLMQLDEFYHNILRVIDAWFCGGSRDEKTEFISETIFSSGAWGTSGTHHLASSVKEKQSDSSVPAHFLHRARRLLFPSAEIMVTKYPVLEAHPAMLPLVWIRRPFDILLFRRDSLRYQAKVTPSKVSRYEQALDYVGLRFNFRR